MKNAGKYLKIILIFLLLGSLLSCTQSRYPQSQKRYHKDCNCP
jgi:hypothetical protein